MRADPDSESMQMAWVKKETERLKELAESLEAYKLLLDVESEIFGRAVEDEYDGLV